MTRLSSCCFLGADLSFVHANAYTRKTTRTATAKQPITIAVIVLVGTAIGFSVFLESVRYIGPVKATLIGCLEPVTATVLSAALFQTRFSWAELLGFGFVLLTVFLSVFQKKH